MNDEQAQRRQFERLWSDFLEGDLSEEQQQLLQKLLAENEQLLSSAVEQYQMHRLLGVLLKSSPEFTQLFTRETLKSLCLKEDTFVHDTMQRILQSSPSGPADSSKRENLKQSKWSSPGAGRLSIPAVRWLAAGIALAVPLLVFVALRSKPQPDVVAVAEVAANPARGLVKFSNIARAHFFGELPPGIDSVVPLMKTYVLKKGMVELKFAKGAMAIIEGPAVFRARNGECLELDMGKCSVQAPDGAEGFRVDTPDTNVVDRGTRFSLNVTDFNETEVQVVEGVADLYQKSHVDPHDAQQALGREQLSEASRDFRLVERQSMRVQASKDFKAVPAPFQPHQYRRMLPDRVVSYRATTGPDERAENLIDVTLQRDGQVQTIPVEEFIPVKLVSFRAANVDRGDFLLGMQNLPADRRELMSDHSLITGIINPGGSETPLLTSPVIKSNSSSETPLVEKGLPHVSQDLLQGTPGIGFQFVRDVINRPGPDIVLFEIHPISSPTDGDAFHVGPLSMKKHHRAITIKEYDLSIGSPQTLPVTQMYVHYNLSHQFMNSLDDVLTTKFVNRPVRFDYRALAVAIDLSDLGFHPGEAAEGLFIQDAEDGEGRVDPVFIGGIP